MEKQEFTEKEERIMDLDRLNKAIGTYDVASYLFSLDNGKTLKTCLAIAEAANDVDAQIEKGVKKVIGGADDVDEDKPTLAKALANTPAPSRTKPDIVVGKNKSKTMFSGLPKDNSTRSFNKASDTAQKVGRGMSEAEFLDSHRGVNWVDPERDRAAAKHVKTVKDAVKKSLANKATCESEHGINKIAETILAAKVAGVSLKEYVSGQHNSPQTTAQRTIMPHSRPSEDSVRNRLPSSFQSNPLSTAQRQKDVNDITNETTSIRVKDYNTRNSLPPEFAAIKPSQDNSFKAISGRMKSDTVAGKSIYKGKPQFTHDNSTNDQGSISPNRPSATPPKNGNPNGGVSFGARTYKDHPASGLQQWPEEPTGDTGSNIESGRGYF
jgi:hypothetical protein